MGRNLGICQINILPLNIHSLPWVRDVWMIEKVIAVCVVDGGDCRHVAWGIVCGHFNFLSCPMIIDQGQTI